jgi:PKD repeat protein
MIKHILLIILSLLLLSKISVADESYAFFDSKADTTISYIEYFFNDDPGFGNGVSVPVEASEKIENLNFSVDIQSLDMGFNYFYLRAKDHLNQWSQPLIHSFYKEIVRPDTADVEYIEYFINNDPGFGNAIEIPIAPATSSGNITFVVDISELQNGFHYLYVRSKNEKGFWSFTTIRSFFKETFYSAPANIVYAEYFLNTDPGKGNGIAIPLQRFSAANSLNFTVDISEMETGFHHLYVRAMDDNGHWSMISIKSFYNETIQPVADITYLEYFLNDDPGVRQGTSIAIPGGSNLSNVNVTIDVSGIAGGFHRLYLRASDANGRQSITNIKSFYKESILAETPNLVKAEYFFNTDPGEGNGIDLPLSAASNIQQYEFIADVWDLPFGENRLYVRVMDAQGKWSLTNNHVFETGCSQVAVDFELSAGCAGYEAELIDLSTNIHPNAAYIWDFGDGTPHDTTAPGDIFHTYTDTGYYQVTLTVINREDCIDSITKTIYINPPPFVDAGEDQTVCAGGEIILDAAFAYGTLSWDQGVANGEPFIIEETTTFLATVESVFGCGAIHDQITFTVIPQPMANAGTDNAGCRNEAFGIINASVENSSSVMWTPLNGNGYFDDPEILQAIYHPASSDPDTVVICLEAFPNDPCTISHSDCMNLVLTPPADVQISFPENNDTICASSIVDLAAVAENFESCYWYTGGDGEFGNPNETVTTYNPGADDIAVGFVDLCIVCLPQNGCTNMAEYCITLSIQPDPQISLATSAYLDCSHYDFSQNTWLPFQLEAAVENQAGLLWTTNGDGNFDNQNMLAASYTPGINDALSGSVTLSLVAWGPDECDLTVSKNIVLHIPTQIIPIDNAGWRGISSYVNVSGFTMPEVLLPVESHLQIIRDENNKSYIPATGINSIGNWSATGYMANFFNPPACLPVYGEHISDKILEITKQVTYLPVLNDLSISIETLFEGHLQKIQSIYDWSTLQTWTPTNAEFNLLQPGFAYSLTMCNPADSFRIEFPPYSFEDSLSEVVISGRIINSENGLPVENVELLPEGIPSSWSGANGEFSLTVPVGWSGMITAVKSEWEFDPSERFIQNVRVNIYDQNFDGIDHSCNPGWSYQSTPVFHTIAIPLAANPVVFGNPLAEGDFIGVFYLDGNDEAQCGGYVQWSGISNVQITAFGDDPFTTEKDGFAEGEEIIWKIYACSDEIEWDAFAAWDQFMPQFSGVFEAYGFSALVSLNAQVCQEFHFSENWNDISLNILPFNPAVEQIFSSMDENLIIFKNLSSFYWPSNSVNTIGNWNPESGYVLKTGAAETITLCGAPIGNVTLNLSSALSQWHYLPVLSRCEVNADEIFGSHAGKITIVKELMGFKVWWPTTGIYSLQHLEPGRAYEIMISQDVSLEFPQCTQKSTLVPEPDPVRRAYDDAGITLNPSTHTIAILSSAAESLEAGTILGAYDQAGNCFGISKNSDKNSYIILFGDDPITDEKDGFFDGEEIIFKCLAGESSQRLLPTFDQSFPQSDGFYTTNGLSVITGFQEATGILENNSAITVNIYPNPTAGKVNISGLQAGAKISINDLHGREVASLVAQAELSVFDISGLQPGVYFVKIDISGHRIIKKLMLQ